MTMVGLLTKNGQVIAVSDLMLTGVTSKAIDFPTIDGSYELKGGPGPFRLCQKICILGKTMIFGWSGSYVQARIFLSLLMEHQIIKKTNEEIRDFISSYPSYDIDELEGFIAAYDESGRGINVFSINTCNYETEFSEQYIGIGSGNGDLYAVLDGSAGYDWIIPPEVIEKIGFKTAQAQLYEMKAVAYLGYMLVSQIDSGYGLENGWGGGIDIVSLREGVGFSRNTSILIRTWMSTYEKENKRIAVREGPYVFFQTVIEGKLVLVSKINNYTRHFIVPELLDNYISDICLFGRFTPHMIVDVMLSDGIRPSRTTIKLCHENIVSINNGVINCDLAEGDDVNIKNEASGFFDNVRGNLMLE